MDSACLLGTMPPLHRDRGVLLASPPIINTLGSRPHTLSTLSKAMLARYPERIMHRAPAHTQRVTNFVNFLEQRTKRASLTDKNWDEFTDEVLDYLECEKKGEARPKISLLFG